MAYASAYDAWLDPEAERKNPTLEYAELIRQAVSFENAKLRKLCADMSRELAIKFAEETGDLPDESWEWYDRMCSLGIEVPA
jgi:hypothetical protein